MTRVHLEEITVYSRRRGRGGRDRKIPEADCVSEYPVGFLLLIGLKTQPEFIPFLRRFRTKEDAAVNSFLRTVIVN